jgi:hypothetical protein
MDRWNAVMVDVKLMKIIFRLLGYSSINHEATKIFKMNYMGCIDIIHFVQHIMLLLEITH